MRRYSTITVAGYIRQKQDIVTKYGKPSRQLTADDFEYVPEHEEQQLVEVCCDRCGTKAAYFHPSTADESESALFSIQLYRASERVEREECTTDFLPGYWYEFCEPCMSNTVAPYLKSLRRSSAPESPEPQEEEAAVVAATADSLRLNRKAQGPLIGEEDDLGTPTQLPPLSDDEPF